MRGTAQRLTLAAAVLLAAPAAADWLVLADGSRVETKGAWEVKGRQVLFHLPNGAFSSLRLDAVDLPASEAASAAEEAPAPAPAPVEKRPPVLVLTQDDLPPVLGAGSPSASPAPEAVEVLPQGEGGESAETAQARLTVVSWQALPAQTDGTVITGVLVNESANLAARIRVTVLLDDADGELLASADAQLGGSSLKPTQRTNFRASLPGVFNYDRVRFEIDHLALDISSPESMPPEGARPEIERREETVVDQPER